MYQVTAGSDRPVSQDQGLSRGRDIAWAAVCHYTSLTTLSFLRIRLSLSCKQPRRLTRPISHLTPPRSLLEVLKIDSVRQAVTKTTSIRLAIHKPTPPLPTGRSHTHDPKYYISVKHHRSLDVGPLTTVAHLCCSDSGASVSIASAPSRVELRGTSSTEV